MYFFSLFSAFLNTWQPKNWLASAFHPIRCKVVCPIRDFLYANSDSLFSSHLQLSMFCGNTLFCLSFPPLNWQGEDNNSSVATYYDSSLSGFIVEVNYGSLSTTAEWGKANLIMELSVEQQFVRRQLVDRLYSPSNINATPSGETNLHPNRNRPVATHL